MSSIFDDIKTGLNEATAYANGGTDKAITHTFTSVGTIASRTEKGNSMRRDYDFNKGIKNPYAKRLKKQKA